MNKETLFNLFVMISPFLAAYLTYYFGVKGKRKEVDFEREKEINTVLSNLLVVWHYLSKIEQIMLVVNDEHKSSIIPKNQIPKLMLQSGMLNDTCFSDLDTSIILLKRYDPILYFKLEGIGGRIDTIKKKYIIPFLTKNNLDPHLIRINTHPLLKQTLDDIEELLELISKQLSEEVVANVRSYVHKHRETKNDDLLKEINESYYSLVLDCIPDNIVKPSYEEFLEISKTEEFKQSMKIQIDLMLNNNLNEFLEILDDNPNISVEDANKMLKKDDPINADL